MGFKLLKIFDLILSLSQDAATASGFFSILLDDEINGVDKARRATRRILMMGLAKQSPSCHDGSFGALWQHPPLR